LPEKRFLGTNLHHAKPKNRFLSFSCRRMSLKKVPVIDGCSGPRAVSRGGVLERKSWFL
jgi:hypothetical protein